MTATKNLSKTGTRGRPAVTDREREDMQARISKTAQHLFQTEGFSKISMRKLAREIGCSPMTLYKYYDSKMDILRTLWSDVFEDLFQGLDDLGTPENTAEERLQTVASGYVSYWLTHPDHYRLVFMAEGVTQSDVSLFSDSPIILERFQVFAALIYDMHGGQLSDKDLKLKSESLICFLNGIAHNHITISGYSWADADHMAYLAIRAVVDGPSISLQM